MFKLFGLTILNDAELWKMERKHTFDKAGEITRDILTNVEKHYRLQEAHSEAFYKMMYEPLEQGKFLVYRVPNKEESFESKGENRPWRLVPIHSFVAEVVLRTFLNKNWENYYYHTFDFFNTKEDALKFINENKGDWCLVEGRTFQTKVVSPSEYKPAVFETKEQNNDNK